LDLIIFKRPQNQTDKFITDDSMEVPNKEKLNQSQPIGKDDTNNPLRKTDPTSNAPRRRERIQIKIKEEDATDDGIDDAPDPKLYRCFTEISNDGILTTQRDIHNKRTVWGPKRRLALHWKNDTKDHEILEDDLLKAMDYWQNACGVQFSKDEASPFFTFVLASEKDESENENVVARSFFPGDNPQTVTLYKRYKTAPNKIAVLAHELGHLLGFRHEHIWTHLTSEPIANAEALTSYDPNSIMHYQKIWDDEKANIVTKLSHLDRMGSQIIYGLPLNAADSLNMLDK